MWYSGGEQYEPNAIGYATSPDGLAWTKHGKNPVFTGDRSIPWEQDRVAGCQVEKHGDYYLMFYIGYRDIDHAQIGLARIARTASPVGSGIRPTRSSARARTSGTTTPATSPMRSSTARNGCSGTTAATAAWSRSAWSCTRARTWVSIGYPQSLDGPRSYNLHRIRDHDRLAQCRRGGRPVERLAVGGFGNNVVLEIIGSRPEWPLRRLPRATCLAAISCHCAAAQRPHLQGHRLHGLACPGQ